jgi:Ni/Fe-hydrogenase subunit HybB-like protein
MPEITGFAFPNDIHVHWSLMIVMYPYITGFVAGSFIVTSLYHVFGRQEFKPLAKLSLAASFCFLLIAGMPLQLHLGHPLRGPMVMVTPNFTSAMAGFGILYTTYLVIVAFEVWFVWRQDIIETARRSRGLKRSFYKALALWTYDSSEEARAL